MIAGKYKNTLSAVEKLVTEGPSDVLKIKDFGVDEETFMKNLDELVELAFDDQCTGANPAYPFMSDIKQIYIDAYYGNV